MELESGQYRTGEVKKFNVCNKKLTTLVFSDTEEYKTDINRLLDELNSIDYALRFLNNRESADLLAQCCYLVPLSLDIQVTKLCQLIINVLSKQQMVLDNCLETITKYLIEGLQHCKTWAFPEILRALAVVLYENGGKLSKHHDILLGQHGILYKFALSTDENILRGTLQCLENICIKTPNAAYLSDTLIKQVKTICLQVLQSTKPNAMDEMLHARLLISSLRAIHNILLATKTCEPGFLGPLLAAFKVYILFGLPGTSTVVAPCLYPTPLSQYSKEAASPPNKEAKSPSSKAANSPDVQQNAEKSSQAKKGRKKRQAKPRKDNEQDAAENPTQELSMSRELSHNAAGQDDGRTGSRGDDARDLYLPWTHMSSSESEFSDTEGAQSSKLRGLHSRVRQCAMGGFHSLIKACEKKVMFGYWPAFIPDTPVVSGPTLFTAIMKDSSPKSRAAGLAVLAALLEGSKTFLMAAEDSDRYRSAPFTPFSVTLGHMVKEIHRCLLLSLVSESSPRATTQVIKCLATLVPNVPYQRLNPGLISRIVKQIRPFLSHRDPNIRVACLTCLGTLCSVQAPLLEVAHLLQPHCPPSRLSESTTTAVNHILADPQSVTKETELDGASSAASAVAVPQATSSRALTPGDIPTPKLPSGAVSPSQGDGAMVTSHHNVSWMVKLCVRNVAPQLLAPSVDEAEKAPPLGENGLAQPLPVTLESLQLLANLAKGYFPILRGCLTLMRDVISCCLDDKDPAIQLHGEKLLEEIAAMLLLELQSQPATEGDSDADKELSQVLEFWLPLLNGPLTSSLQTVTYHAVRSTMCDCLANVGAAVFEKLPVAKRLLCMTLLLGQTSDEDHHVRAAAIRALGVYVLYPALREDVSFVADTANSVITALGEQNHIVRVKAAWSLGNLSDALIMNKTDDDQMFQEDFSDMLLLKLFEVSVKASQDKDKVRSNAVRAIGSLLRYLPERCLKSSRFEDVIEASIKCLIKNISTGIMKVRWNACYAAGSLFRNPLLPFDTASWTHRIMLELLAAVKNCKNFKVRINAALALAVPERRSCYGDETQYASTWESLVTALQASESVADFSEYKYQENLIEQVCCTLIHMLTLVTRNDLTLLSACLRGREEALDNYFGKYHLIHREQNQPNAKEKEFALKCAIKHLIELRESAELGVAEGDLVVRLKSLLTDERKEAPAFAETDDPSMVEKWAVHSSPVSGFIQTYD